MKIAKNPGDGKMICYIDLPKNENLRLRIEQYDFKDNEFNQLEERKLVSHMWSDHENLYLLELPSGLRGLYRISIIDSNGRILKSIKRHIGEKIRINCCTGKRNISDGGNSIDVFVVNITSNMNISGDCVYYNVADNDVRYYIPGEIKIGENLYALQRFPSSIEFHADESVIMSIEILDDSVKLH